MYFDYHNHVTRHGDADITPGKKIFADWHFIQCGSINWLKGKGDQTGSARLYSATPADVLDPPGVRFVPRGIRIRACKARKEGPLDFGDLPWESGLEYPSIMHDDGLYRMWYMTVPPDTLGHPRDHQWVAYAESDDGVTWRKPALGNVEMNGRKTNIVLAAEDCKAAGIGGWSVFKDPSGPESERYKMIFLGSAPTDQIVALGDRLGGPREAVAFFVAEAKKYPGQSWNGIRAAVSPDGLRWRVLDDILMIHFSDTQNTAYYDKTLNRYVGFFRMNYAGRRHIGRSETGDFRSWPLPVPTLTSIANERPCVDYYTNAKCVYPGSPDMHLMFPMLYDHSTDFSDIHLAASYDSSAWSFVPGGPVVERGGVGEWDGGFNVVFSGIVRRPDGTLAAPYHGSPMPHKYPRHRHWGGGAGFATWPKGRLVALESDQDGEFWTLCMVPCGRTLVLNSEVLRAGYLKVAVCNADGEPLPGRGVEDCDSMEGSHAEQTVTWRGQPDLGCKEGQKIVLHFKLRHARIYTFELV